MARLTAAQAGASAMQAGPPPHHEGGPHSELKKLLISIPLTQLKKLPTTTTHIQQIKLPTTIPHSELKKMLTTSALTQLQKLPPTSPLTELNKLPTTTTPLVQLKKLPSTKHLVQFREGCQLEEQLSIFLLSHIHPRRFFSQLLLPSKCLQSGQHTIRRMMMHPHIFAIISPSLLS
jgi:hypothetical protein